MLYLHKALFKGERGPQPGSQSGGDYLKRVQVGVDADGTPKYRYLRTQDEVAAYQSEQKQSGKKKKKDEGGKRLKEKLEGEHKESKRKTGSKDGLLTKSSLYIDLTWGTPDIALVLGDKVNDN